MKIGDILHITVKRTAEGNEFYLQDDLIGHEFKTFMTKPSHVVTITIDCEGIVIRRVEQTPILIS